MLTNDLSKLTQLLSQPYPSTWTLLNVKDTEPFLRAPAGICAKDTELKLDTLGNLAGFRAGKVGHC